MSWVSATRSGSTRRTSLAAPVHRANDYDDDGTAAQATQLPHGRSHLGPTRLDIQDEWFGYRYAAHRTTPNGHDHVRITAYVPPYTTMVANIPWSSGGVHCVPIDDYNCFFFFTMRNGGPVDQMAKRIAGVEGKDLFEGTPYTRRDQRSRADNFNGARRFLPENDYLIDRDRQKDTLYTGIPDFGSQDLMATESMGPIYDRTQEHLGTTDKAVIRMRRILIDAAKGLAEGKEPPCLDASLPYADVRSGEKILAPTEDWRTVGSNDDPTLLQARRMVAEQQTVDVAVGGGGAGA